MMPVASPLGAMQVNHDDEIKKYFDRLSVLTQDE
jgi:hypothetical protein